VINIGKRRRKQESGSKSIGAKSTSGVQIDCYSFLKGGHREIGFVTAEILKSIRQENRKRDFQMQLSGDEGQVQSVIEKINDVLQNASEQYSEGIAVVKEIITITNSKPTTHGQHFFIVDRFFGARKTKKGIPETTITLD